VPDFIARIDDGHRPADFLNLIVEVTGKRDDAKVSKAGRKAGLYVLKGRRSVMAEKPKARRVPVDSPRHKDKRRNIPTEELRGFMSE